MCGVRDHYYLNDLVFHGKDYVSLDYDISLKKGDIKINNDNLTIDGNGHTIDANGKTRIFNVTGKNVIVKNVIFKNGKAPTGFRTQGKGYGGAIRNEGQLELNNCQFINNVAENEGNDIINNSELTIINCKFSKMDNGKNAIFNRKLIIALDSEKNELEPFISNDNVRWISNEPLGPEVVEDTIGKELKDPTITEVEPKVPENKINDVFISFKTEDNKIAHEIYEYLENRGVKCWMSENDLGAGVNFGNEIVNALEESKFLMLIYSKNTPQSQWVKRELYYAAGLEVPIFPVIVDDSKVIENETKFLISSHNWVFLNKENKEESFEEIYEFFREN